MTHLLDTNICTAHFRRPAGLAHRFIQYGGGLCVPTFVLGELYTGAYHVSDPAPLLEKIADLLKVCPFAYQMFSSGMIMCFPILCILTMLTFFCADLPARP